MVYSRVAHHNSTTASSSPSLAMSSTNSSSSAHPFCFFCSRLHFERDCNEKHKASEAAKKQLQECKSCFKRKEQAKDTKDTDTTSGLYKGRLLKSNVLVMQVLSPHPLAPNGLNLVLVLIGTPIQVHHHI